MPKRFMTHNKPYPLMIKDILQHLNQFSTINPADEHISASMRRYMNEKIYGNLESKEKYAQAIIDYISGMTDRYAVAVFNELLRY